jgi:hypothetical protein
MTLGPEESHVLGPADEVDEARDAERVRERLEWAPQRTVACDCQAHIGVVLLAEQGAGT